MPSSLPQRRGHLCQDRVPCRQDDRHHRSSEERCDEEFIRQLVKLGPKHIVYVSCNVHTQARDVGQLIAKDARYKIKSVRGADLFPQTHHVEGVAVLERVDA